MSPAPRSLLEEFGDMLELTDAPPWFKVFQRGAQPRELICLTCGAVYFEPMGYLWTTDTRAAILKVQDEIVDFIESHRHGWKDQSRERRPRQRLGVEKRRP